MTDLGGGTSSSSTLTYLTTDPLGTPVLATDASGASTWSGGFEPFGDDWQAQAGTGASEAGVFLRFPGQWDDAAWEASDFYYNVHRWYEPGTGRYGRVDPLGLRGEMFLYDYSRANPSRWVDRHGLESAPPPIRDPFVPPFDPQFPSGPWGDRPDPRCCDDEKISTAIESTDRQLKNLASGGTPSGAVAGAIIQGHYCSPTGWCQPEGPSPSNPFNPFISPDQKDPCVRFCTRVHEWFHYTDTRRWSIHWDEPTYSTFIEAPAYGLGKACLVSFSGGD